MPQRSEPNQEDKPKDDMKNPNDIDDQVNELFPCSDKTSRFSVHNPLARFTTAADRMRQTIQDYQKNGRPS